MNGRIIYIIPYILYADYYIEDSGVTEWLKMNGINCKKDLHTLIGTTSIV